MSQNELDQMDVNALDVDADDPEEMKESGWKPDPDDEKYVTINTEEQKCPSCLRLANNEIRKRNIVIRKENAEIRDRNKLTKIDLTTLLIPEERPLKSITTTFNISKIDGGWTRYRCKSCGFVHMFKHLKTSG